MDAAIGIQRMSGDRKELAAKLLAALEHDEEPHVFTKQEVSEIQALLDLYRKLDTLKWFGKWALYLLVSAGLIISNLDRIKEFFKL